MHRTFEASIPPEHTDQLVQQLLTNKHVMGVSLQRGVSILPPGDALTIHVLNRGADDVLSLIARRCTGTSYSIITAEQASMIDPTHDEQVENDYDEAIWEEMESGLRHNGRITANYLILMAIGGAIGAVGLVSDPAPQAVAFVAAAVIAPGYDPLAKMALGLTLGKPNLLKKGVESTGLGYVLLIVVAMLSFWLLRLTGAATVADFTGNPEVEHLSHPTARELLLSVCGALAGGVITASYREHFIAGPLMALAFIHAAAMIGVGIAAGEWAYALEGLERFALDALLIVGGCLLVFAIKQRFVHRRKPIV
jgi:hypothetical protein